VIRKAILAAAAIYLSITLVQALANSAVLLQAVVFGAVLAGGGALYFYRDEHRLEKLEVGMLWFSILLFALYMAVKLAGVA
jgi:hypothetical protein